MALNKEYWGQYNGSVINLYSIKRGNLTISITNFGATITAVRLLAADGTVRDMVLGYDSLEHYITGQFYMGGTVGRVAGRIFGGQFSIKDELYSLSKNLGNDHLHGGLAGFNKKVFTVVDESETTVEMRYISPHLEEGYPGNLIVHVRYELLENNEIAIRYYAESDRETHVNLTNHSYFNLSGKKQTTMDHTLFINASSYAVTDEKYIPTGAIADVVNTSSDFTSPRSPEGNNNEYYFLDQNPGVPAAILKHPGSTTALIVTTDMPGLIFYSGDYLQGKFLKNGGLCLETMFIPDAPNLQAFTGTLIRPGHAWKSFTKYRFAIER